MFGFFKKNQSVRIENPGLPTIPELNPEAHRQETEDFGGMTLEAFAQKQGLTMSQAWRKLKSGELIARTEQGRLIVYPTNSSQHEEPVLTGPVVSHDQLPRSGAEAGTPSNSFEVPASSAVDDDSSGLHNWQDESSLPPVTTQPGFWQGSSEHTSAGAHSSNIGLPPPPPSTSEPLTTKIHHHSLSPIIQERTQGPSTEVALLIDHLSLAKEENRDILRFSQETMNRLTNMSDAILALKDALLASKESEIQTLKDKVATQELTLRQLRQEKEDLEMLARTIAEN